MQKSSTRSIHYTNTTPVMNWCSYRFKIRAERASSNSAPVVLQLFIQGKKVVIDMGFRLDPRSWDPDKQQVRGNSEEANRQNFTLNDVRSLIHRIQVDHHLSQRTLTRESFKLAFFNRPSREDFLAFMASEMDKRHTGGQITWETFRQNRSVLKLLSDCYKELPFHAITHQTMEDFERHLRRRYRARDEAGSVDGYHENTIWAKFKTIKTYMIIARNSGIRFEDPFKNFKFRRGHGRIIFLSPSELEIMVHAYKSSTFIGSAHYALRVFLFAAFTSLRISDIRQLTSDDILSDTIVIRPQKTKKKNKVVRIPLNNISRMIIQAAPPQGLLFPFLSEQKINQYLKQIAAMLGIHKRLSMHVGRHTFASEFLRRGGQLHVLKDLMGHSDIKTTMVYVHLDNSHARSQMNLMDNPTGSGA